MIWATDDYTTYNIGALVLHANSSVGGASNLNNILYLQRADGEALPVLNWNVVFTYESGDGFRVNDEIKTPSAIKSTGDGFYWEFDAVSSGDTVSVGGSFVCEAQKTRYIIDESKPITSSGAISSIFIIGTVCSSGASSSTLFVTLVTYNASLVKKEA